MPNSKLRCAVVGASGYSGAELVSLLARHPETTIDGVYADGSAGKQFEDLHPSLRHRYEGVIERFDAEALTGVDVAFLALPHGASALAAKALLGKVGRIIDLSGDLRLADAETYRKWYGIEHPAPELLGRAIYGLPELFPDALKGATLIACAGCYATISQLAAAPALTLGDAVSPRVTISAMSGTTGAGRKADLDLSFSEVGESLRAYRVGRHQHTPEIRQGLARSSRRDDLSVTFVPHLVPIRRGIFATAILETTTAITQERLLAIYRDFYAGSPLVRVIDPAVRLPQLSDVVGTSFADLAPVIDGSGAIVVVGVIDNLLKGAAGQAVQVMNLACGFEPTLGL